MQLLRIGQLTTQTFYEEEAGVGCGGYALSIQLSN